MCVYCSTRLDTELIEKLRDELPDYSPEGSHSGISQAIGVVSFIAATSAGGQLSDAVVSFPREADGSELNAWIKQDAFVFGSLVEKTQSNATDGLSAYYLTDWQQGAAAIKPAPAEEAPADAFWTYLSDAPSDDWFV